MPRGGPIPCTRPTHGRAHTLPCTGRGGIPLLPCPGVAPYLASARRMVDPILCTGREHGRPLPCSGRDGRPHTMPCPGVTPYLAPARRMVDPIPYHAPDGVVDTHTLQCHGAVPYTTGPAADQSQIMLCIFEFWLSTFMVYSNGLYCNCYTKDIIWWT